MIDDRFPTFKFNRSETEYYLLNNKNYKDLAAHIKQSSNYKLLIMSTDDDTGWNETFLPDMSSFEFLEELRIHWTNVNDITEIHKCKNLRTLIIDNGDKTPINFAVFSKLENFVSWDRKEIEDIWDVPNLKSLTVAGLKRNHFKKGKALETISKLRIIKTPMDNIDFLGNCQQLAFLELLEMSKIEKLDILGTLPKLVHLRVEANKVKDFSFIAKLNKLQTCYLSSKNAEMNLTDFENLPEIKRVVVDGNNNAKAINKKLQANYFKA